MQAEPCIFQHPLAIEDFRLSLASKYTPDALEKRLGFRDPKYVLPPHPDWALGTIDDPLFQEWTDFRCQTLSRYYEEMAAFIHSLNPAVAVEYNPHSGLSGLNTYWFEGVDYPRLLAHTQAVWSEEGNEARGHGGRRSGLQDQDIQNGRKAGQPNLHLHGRFLMAVHRKAKRRRSWNWPKRWLTTGSVWGWWAAFSLFRRLPESAKRYIQFFHKNFRLFRDIESAADVAVLHSFATLAFNNDRPYQSTWLFEQALIQAQGSV